MQYNKQNNDKRYMKALNMFLESFYKIFRKI